MVTQHTSSVVPAEFIEHKIYVIRGEKVMLDSDLAELYQVKTFNLNKAVKRNLGRFPKDFMFQLTKEETENLRLQTRTSSLRFQTGILENQNTKALRSQFATLETGRGKHSKYQSYTFTEQGIAMLSSVLRSERAVQMNIFIMRTFISLRKNLIKNTQIKQKIKKIDEKLAQHDDRLDSLSAVVKQIINPPLKPKRRMGFTAN